MKSIFNEGNLQRITDVLANRDDRVALQNKLIRDYPNAALLAIKLNIPGPIKNNNAIYQLFARGMTRFYYGLNKITADYYTQAQWNKDTGNEMFITVNDGLPDIKKFAVSFEDHDLLGRLFDIDVLGHLHFQALSRTDLKLPVRKCLICNRIAKDCARSRRHSVSELQDKITRLYEIEIQTMEDENNG